jgi:hypothetical protein
VAAMAVLQLGFTYLPAMQRIFQTRPLAWHDWPLILAVGWGIALLVSLEKGLLYRAVPSRPRHARRPRSSHPT